MIVGCLNALSYKGVEFATSNVIGPLTLYFIGLKSCPMWMLVYSFLVYQVHYTIVIVL